ncbi:MAG: delta-60 repeat domain-containing protein [Candidatus Binatia bacterium]
MPAAGRPGDLDPTLRSGGVGYQNLASSQSRINDVVLLPDGRFIAAGFRRRGRNNDPALIRYQSNGTVDTSFGNGGVASVGFGNGSDYAEAVTRQSDGKLVVAGWSASLSPNRWALARFTADGIIDPTFGNGGTVMTLLQSGGCEAYAVVQQADGKLVAAGRASNGGSYYLALVRYNADGSLDTTFGSGGIVVQPLGASAVPYTRSRNCPTAS